MRARRARPLPAPGTLSRGYPATPAQTSPLVPTPKVSRRAPLHRQTLERVHPLLQGDAQFLVFRRCLFQGDALHGGIDGLPEGPCSRHRPFGMGVYAPSRPDHDLRTQILHHLRHHPRNDASTGHGERRPQLIEREGEVLGYRLKLLPEERSLPVRCRVYRDVGARQTRQLAQDDVGGDAMIG